jgi:hypothetical protein
MKRSVYIETTVPSAYVTARTDPSSVSRRELTRLWWSHQRENYDLRISEPLFLELRQGRWPGQAEALALVAAIPRLKIDEEVMGVARRYVAERLVPRDLAGDAIHLAVACVHRVDFLLTWNIRHLANPNKADHLTVVNRRLGLLTPLIVTPETLWMEDDE